MTLKYPSLHVSGGICLELVVTALIHFVSEMSFKGSCIESLVPGLAQLGGGGNFEK